jgi:hypothetical protein
MKQLAKNYFFLQNGKETGKKITAVVGMLLGISLNLGAQNSSYNANTIPIGGNFNAGFGTFALLNTTTGTENVAMGGSVLGFNTTGSFNSGLGYGSLGNNQTGSYNTSSGNRALENNTVGSNNTAIGSRALHDNINGTYNTAIGRDALTQNTGASFNVALGGRALYKSNGSGNTAAGYLSLTNNTSGAENVASGLSALHYNSTGSRNSAYGSGAATFNTTGTENASVGYYALRLNDTANYNTAMGSYAAYNTIGGQNAAVGYYALNNNTTGRYNSALGSLSNSSANNLTNATAIGHGAIVDASDRVWLGDANVAVNDVWSYGTYNTLSDGRFKSNVSESDVKGLEFITLLRPVVYNFEARKATEFMTKNMPEDIRRQHLSADFSEATAIRQSGFIAQEMAEAAKKSGYKFDGVHVPADAENNVFGIAYGQLVVPLVKAVQEMDQQKAALEQKVEKLEKQVQDLMNKAGTATGINQPNTSGIDGFTLDQNIPNPFSQETVINYNLPQQVNSASLVVYDLSGKQITSFPITERGSSSITITSEKLAAGIYIYSVMADGKILDSKRMVVAQK